MSTQILETSTLVARKIVVEEKNKSVFTIYMIKNSNVFDSWREEREGRKREPMSITQVTGLI